MRNALLLLVLLLPSSAMAAVTTVAVVRPAGADFLVAENGLTAELPGGWRVERLIGAVPTAQELSAWLSAHPAQVVVAMDNAHIALATEVVAGRVPVVALMGLNLKQTLAGRVDVCGITYETPIWSLVTGFAARTGTTPARVLAPHRGSVHGAVIADALRLLARQGITLVPLDIEAEARTPAAQAAWLTRNLLRAAEQADAVVVPADNVLVDGRSLPAWLEAARRSNRPFLAPVARLVDERHGFCAYAAEVDHERLGAQAAELVLQLVHDGTLVRQLGVEYLIGVGERLDVNVLRRLGLGVPAPKGP